MKRAFTLIELLVVIAIIAILAAILFPVFAQAKAAAKKTASLSNVKQTMTSTLIYMSDSDDVLPIMTAWMTPAAGSGAFVSFGGAGCIPWTQIVQPYMKNYDLLQDPQGPQNVKSPAGFNASLYKSMTPHYGYNPYLAIPEPPPASDGLGSIHAPTNGTAIARPADTVMFASKYASSEHTSANFWSGYWFGPGTYFISLSVDPPDCYAPGNVRYCASGWNDNSYYGGSAGLKVLKNVEAAGAFSGGASVRTGKQAVVAWVDGHASSRPASGLTAGMNYQGGRTAAGIPTQNETAITLVNNDRTLNQWYGL